MGHFWHMGFGMQRGGGCNANLKGESRVRMFIDAAGLKAISGLQEYLLSLPVHDLAMVSDKQWNAILNQALAGMPQDRNSI